MKPSIEIDLVGPSGNAFAIISIAVKALEEEGQFHEAKEMHQSFLTIMHNGASYSAVRELTNKYCEVTWINEIETC